MEKSIKKNFLLNVILVISSMIFPLISFPYVSRILTPNGTGKVSFALSFISYFSIFAQLGIPTYGIRECAKVRNDKKALSKITKELLVINSVTCLIAYIALGCVLHFGEQFQEDKVLYVVVSASILLNIFGVEWLYKAIEEYAYITVRSLLFKAIAVILMILIINDKDDCIIYGGLAIFASSASNICNMINLHKHIDLLSKQKVEIAKHIKPVLVFFLMACATSIYTHLDVVMLGFISGDTEVGYYDAAVKVKTLLVGIVTSLGAVILPRASYYVEKNRIRDFFLMSKNAVRFVILVATPLVVFFVLCARQSIMILAGNAYTGAIFPMKIIMPTVLFIGISNILGIQILIPLGMEKKVLLSEVIGVIVDVFLNLLLIPKLGASGAAIGTVIAEFAVLVTQLIFARSEISKLFLDVKYYKIIIPLLVGTIAMVLLGNKVQNEIFSFGIMGIVFWGTYILGLILLKEDMCIDIWNKIKYKIFRERNGHDKNTEDI